MVIVVQVRLAFKWVFRITKTFDDSKFALAWAFVILGDSYDLETCTWNPDILRIIRQQDFWFAFGITVL